MRRHALTLTVVLFVAGLVGTGMAAVPDPSPFAWPTAPVEAADDVDLPPVPPPPGRKTDPAPHVVRVPRTDIVLRSDPPTTTPCPDKIKRLPHTGRPRLAEARQHSVDG